MKIDVKGFRDFILRGNVVDLAIAVVVGAAFTAIVSAFVRDIITPLIGAIFGGKGAFGNYSFTLHNSVFHYGDLINAIIYFLIVAAIVYFLVVQPVQALLARFNPPVPDEPPATKECVDCLSTIPAAARRCAFCTVEQ
ncbi:MAG TPA: large conductance mechanosensitive channel protein MscL [Mycobacteriales bacterium]